jgi:exodeoxyribonuclease VIII
MRDSYHDDYSRDSSSSLRLFEESIERYAMIRVYKTMEPPEPTPAMLQGILADMYVLDPDAFHAAAVVAPPTVTRRQKAFEMMLTANPGKHVVTADEMQLFIGIRDGIMRNTKARQIIEAEGDVQKVITWEDKATGAPLKLKEDKILKNGLLANMKVTGDIDPASWARSVLNWSYHAQAALYLDGAWQAEKIDGPMIWVVVSRDPPCECICYTPDEECLALGHRRNEATIQELVDRRSKADWRGRFRDEIQTLTLPAWATR